MAGQTVSPGDEIDQGGHMPPSKMQRSIATQRTKGAPRPQRRRRRGTGSTWVGDFLTFRTMLTPILVQIMFWVGSAWFSYQGFILIRAALGLSDGALGVLSPTLAVLGVFTTAIGVIFIRLICEYVILLYRMNETLTKLLHEQKRANRNP